MEKYTIELTKEQLYLLKDVIYKHYRLLLGQLEIGLKDILVEAGKRNKLEPLEDIEFLARETVQGLKFKFWKQLPNQHNGIHWSEEVDTLIDMEEVIRHQLFLYSGDRKRGLVYEYPPIHWNKKQPLIKLTRKDIPTIADLKSLEYGLED